MNGKKTNSLKPQLTKRLYEVGYSGLNKIPGRDGCLRQKKLIEYLSCVINFWISEVKQYEEIMANKQSQNMRRAYQMDEITHGKGGGYSKNCPIQICDYSLTTQN